MTIDRFLIDVPVQVCVESSARPMARDRHADIYFRYRTAQFGSAEHNLVRASGSSLKVVVNQLGRVGCVAWSSAAVQKGGTVGRAKYASATWCNKDIKIGPGRYEPKRGILPEVGTCFPKVLIRKGKQATFKSSTLESTDLNGFFEHQDKGSYLDS